MTDKLCFFSGSKDVYPGKGTNEEITNPDDYFELSNYQNWRQKLSNFYISPFKYKNKTYRTAEHAFQASKFELFDKDIAYHFCLESKNKIALGDGSIARENRKLILLDDVELIEWNEVKEQIMHDIHKAKFDQNEELKKILLATKNAELWHSAPRLGLEHIKSLEKIRSEYLI